MTAAGSTYASGNNYGSNSVTLNTNHLPAHTHTGPSHTHTMAHTHTGPSHTHTITGTAASAGAHKHAVRTYSSTADTGGLARTSGLYKGQVIVSRNATEHNNATFFTGSDNWNSGGIGGENIGAHTHSVSGRAAAAGNGQTGASSAANTGASGTGNTGSTGKGAAFNNMPKSIAIPLWTRTK